MLDAGPDFLWKGEANKLPALLVQHGDKQHCFVTLLA